RCTISASTCGISQCWSYLRRPLTPPAGVIPGFRRTGLLSQTSQCRISCNKLSGRRPVTPFSSGIFHPNPHTTSFARVNDAHRQLELLLERLDFAAEPGRRDLVSAGSSLGCGAHEVADDAGTPLQTGKCT